MPDFQIGNYVVDIPQKFAYVKYRIGDTVPSSIFVTQNLTYVSFREGLDDKILVFNNLYFQENGEVYEVIE